MSVALLSEDRHRLTHEACELCGAEVPVPASGLEVARHICASMPLTDARVTAWFKAIDKPNTTSILTMLTRKDLPKSVRFLGSPTTIGELQTWSKWDLRQLEGIAWIRARVIERALAAAGLPLADITYQKAAARRSKVRKERMREEAERARQRAERELDLRLGMGATGPVVLTIAQQYTSPNGGGDGQG